MCRHPGTVSVPQPSIVIRRGTFRFEYFAMVGPARIPISLCAAGREVLPNFPFRLLSHLVVIYSKAKVKSPK
jgi:hypothetical protein